MNISSQHSSLETWWRLKDFMLSTYYLQNSGGLCQKKSGKAILNQIHPMSFSSSRLADYVDSHATKSLSHYCHPMAIHSTLYEKHAWHAVRLNHGNNTWILWLHFARGTPRNAILHSNHCHGNGRPAVNSEQIATLYAPPATMWTALTSMWTPLITMQSLVEACTGVSLYLPTNITTLYERLSKTVCYLVTPQEVPYVKIPTHT